MAYITQLTQMSRNIVVYLGKCLFLAYQSATSKSKCLKKHSFCTSSFTAKTIYVNFVTYDI